MSSGKIQQCSNFLFCTWQQIHVKTENHVPSDIIAVSNHILLIILQSIKTMATSSWKWKLHTSWQVMSFMTFSPPLSNRDVTLILQNSLDLMISHAYICTNWQKWRFLFWLYGQKINKPTTDNYTSVVWQLEFFLTAISYSQGGWKLITGPDLNGIKM